MSNKDKDSNSFYDLDKEEITFVPFDIETTGFKSADDDYITNIILFNNNLYHIWINTNNNNVDSEELKDEIIKGSNNLDNISLYVCKSEKEMLYSLGDYLDEQTDNNTILTAFNGETYSGRSDFDVPFLRTRCFRNGVPWILSGFWYCDTYEVFSQSSRFDTTVKAEPSLENMSKTDIEELIKDKEYNIKYNKLYKDDIVNEIEDSDVDVETIKEWTEKENFDTSKRNPEDISTYTTKQLKQLIDDKELDINYKKMSKEDMIDEINKYEFTEEDLINWHEKTGRDIGTKEATTLDGIHKVLIEDKMDDVVWRNELPFEIEVFDPFDPFESSGEAVTEYINGNYSDVILHCFADVSRTVNITRVMKEYAPKKDYRPKVL